MLIKDIVKGLMHTDVYELLIWGIWYFRPGRPSCKQCVETKMMMSKIPPNCAECGQPSAKLIQKYSKSWKKEITKNETKN